MTYVNLTDIPYSELAKGGTFQVQNVPPEIGAVGYGMCAVPSGQDGYSQASAMPGVFRSSDIEAPQNPALLYLVVPYIGLIIKTVCVVVIIVAVTQFVYTLKAVPQGEVIEELDNGSKVYQSSDGSTWLLNPDGTSEQIGDPTATDVEKTITTLAIVIVIIVIAIASLTFITKRMKAESKAEPD